MNFLNKKILFRTTIIVILIIVIGIGAFFYWQEIYKQKTDIPSDVSQEEIKAKCLENVSKMTDEQIIEKINNLSFASDEGIQEIGRRTYDYLACNFKNDREKLSRPIQNILYDKTSMLFQQLKLEKTMETLWPGDPPPVSVSNVLAFEPTELICLDDNKEKAEFLELCLRNVEDMKDKLSLEEIEEMENNCRNICDFVDKYTNNISLFEDGYLKKTKWVDSELLLTQQMFVRIALSFRLGNEDIMLRACDYAPTLELKEDCEKYVDSLDYIKNCKRFDYGGTKECIYKECAEIRQVMIDLICEL